MSNPVSLLAFCGSAREDSINRKALAVLIGEAERAGARITLAEPRQFPLPLYDGDLEAHEGLPDKAAQLQQLCAEHDGFLIASPEYNGFFTPLLKNTFDWISRPLPDDSGRPGSIHLRDKPAGVVSASPGGLGGVRALPHTRQYLGNLGLLVVPQQAGIAHADDAFDEDGYLKNRALHDSVSAVARAVITLAAALPR